jgi:hypothetical protein
MPNEDTLPDTTDLALHEQRVADLVEAGWTINPDLFGATYVTWRRLMREQGRNSGAVHRTRYAEQLRTERESRWTTCDG